MLWGAAQLGIRKLMALVLYLPPDAMTTLMSQQVQEPKEKASPVDQLKTLARALRARPQDGA